MRDDRSLEAIWEKEEVFCAAKHLLLFHHNQKTIVIPNGVTIYRDEMRNLQLYIDNS